MRPCLAEMPNMKSAFDAGRGDGRFAMVSLSVDEKAADAERYVRKNGLGWTQAFLPGAWESPVVKAYGVRSIPMVVLIGPDGKVVATDLRGDGIKAAVTAALAR